ncbi:MAG TPA: TIGR04283 family arsenosugar biosynthesis glycosyltransferase, partial [Candidatus Competibacteraceae bacterium]|nr:TIGR04283 family arsenosugar biosynthesis glycosyltransferase [Candidatus Competibacteraceae bacterium]
MDLISIIVPVLNEAAALPVCLQALQSLRRQDCELLVVDGGSTDASVTIARTLADRVLSTPAGRAVQMNAGAQVAHGDILWFLHGDSLPPPDAAASIRVALVESNRCWGRFDVRLSGNRPLLRIVETLMNRRSRLTGIATGDQGIFVRRWAFAQVGGYPAIPLMEDIALSRALKRLSRPVCLCQHLLTSSRRWEQQGIWKTIF